MQILETKLSQLKSLEDTIKLVTEQKDALRKEILGILETVKIDQWKNDVATISKVTKNVIKYEKPIDEILKELENQKLVKYFQVIPEEIIPEHKQISKQFEEDVKNKTFQVEGVSIVTTITPMIRFN